MRQTNIVTSLSLLHDGIYDLRHTDHCRGVLKLSTLFNSLLYFTIVIFSWFDLVTTLSITPICRACTRGEQDEIN